MKQRYSQTVRRSTLKTLVASIFFVASIPTAHAAPCPRAYRLPAGATAPCAGELLPSPTLDALLEQMDTARRLKVQLDEDALRPRTA